MPGNFTSKKIIDHAQPNCFDAHAGNKNARPTPIGRANYFRNEKDDTRKKTVITKID